MSRSAHSHGPVGVRSALAPAGLLAAAGLGLAAGASATDFSWNSPASGVFSNTALWTPAGAPSLIGDTALIDQAGVYMVTVDTDLSIHALTLDAADAVLFAQGRLVDVAWALSVLGGTLDSRGSTFGGAGGLDIASGATFLARGATTLQLAGANAGLLWINGASGVGNNATLTINDTLTNSGVLRMESSGVGWTSNLALGPAGVVLNAASGVIEINPGSGGSRSVTGGTLTNQGGIATNAFVILDGVSYEAAGGVIGDQHRFRNSTISVSASAAGGTTLHLEGGNNALESDNLADTTLWIRGSNGGNTATLTVADDFSNAGTIRLQSIDTGWAATLNLAGSELHNAAGGVLEANFGTGGSRSIVGSIRNDGLVSVEAATLLTISDAAPFSFVQQSGSISALGELRLNGADFVFTGGTIDGTVRVDNGTIDIASTAGPGTVIAASDTGLTNNSSTATTVWVQGSNATGAAELSLTGDAENRGVIRVESINSGWHSRINTGASTLTNQAGGVVEANFGTGGDRSIRGAVVNRGDIVVGEGAFLNIIADYTADGGHVLGNHAFSEDSILRTTSAPALRGELSTMIAVGDDILFEGDLLSGYELWVRGGGLGGGAATTMATDGATNRGVIRLESINTNWNSSLAIGQSSFTNGTTGTLDVRLGTGGQRIVTGDAYTFTNRGDINVEALQTLSFTSINGFTLRQAQGEINADGLLDIVNGYFNFTGGDIDGSVRVSNGETNIGAGVAGLSEVIVGGSASVLRDNLSPLATVWVQGSGARGTALLTPSNPSGDTVTNLGTIRMESINTNWNSSIAAGPDELLNGVTGVIDVQFGSGGDRTIAGAIRNQGLISVGDDAFLRFTDAAYTGEGGVVLGNHAFRGTGTIALTAAAGQEHTLVVDGTGVTMLTDITAGHEIWSRGGGVGASIVGLADGGENHGVLRLESIGTNWNSGAAVIGNGRFTNAADGRFLVELGSGGGRSLGLLFENAGEAIFNTGATFTGDADLGSVINSGQWTMNTTGVVAANSSVATPTTFENSGTLSGVGTIALDGGDGLFVNSGLLSPGMSVGLLAFDSGFEQTSTGTLAIELAAPGTANGDRLTVTEAASLDGAVEVALLNGYTPDWGDRWSIITYDSVVGDMDLTAPALADPLLRWWTEATPDSFDIGVRHVADVNHDDFIDFSDLNLVVSFFNMFGDGLPGDANEDGAVDFADLNLVVSYFNTQAPANVPAPGGAALAALAIGVAGRRRRAI